MSHILVFELAVIIVSKKARMNLNLRRRFIHGACYNLQVGHRVIGSENSTYMLAENELPVYTDSQSGGPLGYDTVLN